MTRCFFETERKHLYYIINQGAKIGISCALCWKKRNCLQKSKHETLKLFPLMPESRFDAWWIWQILRLLFLFSVTPFSDLEVKVTD